MDLLTKLMGGVRTLSTHGQLHIVPSTDLWVAKIVVGDIVLFETDPGTVESVVRDAVTKLAGISQRMMQAVRIPDPPSS